MSFYTILLELSQSYCRFEQGGFADLLRFDLDNKSIFNGKTVLMEKGQILLDKITLRTGKSYDLQGTLLIDEDDLKPYGIENIRENPYDIIYMLYELYKYSTPSSHARFSRCNFKVLKADELNFQNLLNGVNRVETQYLLEGYILLASLYSWIPWTNTDYWFRKDKRDRDLVLFRNWVLNESKKIIGGM